MTADATTTNEEEEMMVSMLRRLVKKDVVFPANQSDEEAAMDPDVLSDQETEEEMERVKKSDDEGYDMNGEITITKVDKKKGLVFGWASVIERDGEIVVDRDNDYIDDEWELEKSAYAFVTSCRVGGDNHVRKGVSHLIESMVITQEKIDLLGLPQDTQKGWWAGWQITDPDTLDALEKGEFTGFSVHGKGKRSLAKGKKAGDMTFNDLREVVQQGLKDQHTGRYCYIRDMTDSWVVYEVESGATVGGATAIYPSGLYKTDYTISDGTVSFGDATQVTEKRTTQYVSKGQTALDRFNALKDKP